MKRRGRKSAAQTPAPIKDRIKGSDVNPKDSATKKNASKIKLSFKTMNVLNKKLEDFKEKNPKKKNVSLNDLEVVYRRGSGAYSKSHRPTITGGKPNSRAAWSFARVNKFLEKAAGKQVKKSYVQDDDLLKAENGAQIDKKIQLPDTESSYENLQPILANQGYVLVKSEFLNENKMDMEQQIECIKCGWQWNTEDSDESDKYVCHKCGFDNTLFYEKTLLKPNLSVEEISKKHNVSFEYIENQLDIGRNHEMEHTENEEFAEKIALHHIAEIPDYYEKIESLNLENGGELLEYEIIEYIKEQRQEADDVLNCEDSRIFKAMIAKTKMEMARKREQEAQDGEEKNVWNECALIWKNCLNDIENNNIKKLKDGGKPCGCGQMYSKGGLAYGNSHDKGGMPMKVLSTGQNIEIEGGEGVINKRSMQMTKKLEFEGKRMTPCEVISKINQMGGGVKFKCEDVKEIIAADGHF